MDGYPNTGSISQAFATAVGVQYTLSFAYANNPYRVGPAVATVYVQDALSSANLMAPLVIAHGSATASNYDWTLSGPLNFVAQGSSTRLMFVSNDVINTDAGIFLDAISVVPEPGSFVLLGIGGAALSWIRIRRRRV